MSEFARTTFTNYPNSSALSKIDTGGVLARDAFFGTVNAPSIYEFNDEGTIAFSGASEVAHVVIIQSEGTLTLSGSSVIENSQVYEFNDEGTLNFDGSTAIAHEYAHTSEGTLTFSGSSVIENPQVYEFNDEGTLNFNGFSSIAHEYAHASEGTLTFEGYALIHHIVTTAYESEGTLTFSGTSEIESTRITEFNDVGTLNFSGHTDYEFISVVPEAKGSGTYKKRNKKSIKFDYDDYKKKLEEQFKKEQELNKPTVYEFNDIGYFNLSVQSEIAHEIIFKSFGTLELSGSSEIEFEDKYAYIRASDEEFILNNL